VAGGTYGGKGTWVMAAEQARKVEGTVSRRQLMRQTLWVAGVAVGGSALLAACGPTAAHSSKASGSGGGAKSTFRVGANILPSQLSNYNPFEKSGNWSQIFDYLYDPLFFFSQVTGKFVNRLGTGYSWNTAGTQLTVTLHPSARWHDGKAVTAGDVAFTYQLLKQYPAFDTYALWQQLQSVAATPQGTVVFSLQQPFPSLPAYLSTVYIVPQHIWGSVNASQYLNSQPVGSGPFMFDHYTAGTDVLLKANPSYFLGAPQVGYLDIVMYANSSDASLALINGTVDTPGGGIAMPSLPQMLKQPGTKFQVYAGLTNYAVFLNNANPLLQNKAVRQAVARAISRQNLITQGEQNAVFPANPGWIPTSLGSYCDSALITDTAYGYNPQAAVQLLTQAGFKRGADGIFADATGRRLSFTYYEAASAPAQDKEASMIQQNLQAVGIQATAKTATGPELTTLLRSGGFDMLQNGGTFPPDPQAALFAFFASSESAAVGSNTVGLNYARYKNTQVDALLKQSATMLDVTGRTNIYLQVQKILAEDAPVALMYNVGGHIPYSTTRFSGYRTDVPVDSALSLMAVTPA